MTIIIHLFDDCRDLVSGDVVAGPLTLSKDINCDHCKAVARRLT